MHRSSDTGLERIEVGLLAEVRAGLRAARKKLPGGSLMNRRTLALREALGRIPEHYLVRAEHAALDGWLAEQVAQRPVRTLVELAAWSAEQAGLLLASMAARVYMPVDRSASTLRPLAALMRVRHPGLVVLPIVARLQEALPLRAGAPGPRLVTLLGNTLGHLLDPAAQRLLRRLHVDLERDDRLLLGVDLRKDPMRLEKAYDDATGIAAELSRNLLETLRRRLGAEVDPDEFRHAAVYRPASHRVELQLVARRDQTIRIPGVGDVHLAEGEPIRIGVRRAFDREQLDQLLGDAGLRIDSWRTDPRGDYAVAMVGKVGEGEL